MNLNDISELIDKLEYQISSRNLTTRYAMLDDIPVRVFTDHTNKIDVIFEEGELYDSIENDEKLKFRFMASDGRKFTKLDQKQIAESVRKVEQIYAYQLELGMLLRAMEYEDRIITLGWHPHYGSFVWDDDYLYPCYEDEDGNIMIEVLEDEEEEREEENAGN